MAGGRKRMRKPEKRHSGDGEVERKWEKKDRIRLTDRKTDRKKTKRETEKRQKERQKKHKRQREKHRKREKKDRNICTD